MLKDRTNLSINHRQLLPLTLHSQCLLCIATMQAHDTFGKQSLDQYLSDDRETMRSYLKKNQKKITAAQNVEVSKIFFK